MTSYFSKALAVLALAVTLPFASRAANTTAGVVLGPGPNVATTYHYTVVGDKTATPLNGGTNNVARASTNIYNLSIDARNYTDVDLQVTWALNGAGTSATTVVIEKSNDNTNWFSFGSVGTANNGTNTTGFTTNLVANSTGYFRVKTVGTAQASSDVTNVVALVFKKPLRFGPVFPGTTR